MSDCINLNDQFGDRYKITWDQSAYYKHDKTPWMMTIEGTYGTIYPYSKDLLAVECDHHRSRQRKLLVLGLELHQDGDRAKTFLFPPEQMPEVAKIIKAYKKRQHRPQTPEQRQKMLVSFAKRWRRKA